MKLSRAEWAQAQDLLVKLVQALTPVQESRTFIKQNFFPPINGNPETLKEHRIQLLHTLKLTQKQISTWIDKLPSGKAEVPQVKSLIGQVRVAIQTLATQENLMNPKAVSLRAAFLRIKPLIDEMIEAGCRGDDSDDPARKKKRTWTRKKKEEKKDDL